MVETKPLAFSPQTVVRRPKTRTQPFVFSRPERPSHTGGVWVRCSAGRALGRDLGAAALRRRGAPDHRGLGPSRAELYSCTALALERHGGDGEGAAMTSTFLGGSQPSP